MRTDQQADVADGAAIPAFVAALYESDDWVERRVLPSGRSTWHRARDINSIRDACLLGNREQGDVYVGVNPRRAYGQRGNAGVMLARCVFVDFDGKHLRTTAPADQIAEVRRRLADAQLPEPTILLHSGHGVHAYWRLTEPVADLSAWDELMDALITTLGSDISAKGRERIMRVPSLVNWKPPPAVAQLVECDPSRRAEWEDLACTVFHSNLPEPRLVPDAEAAIARLSRGHQEGRATVIDTFNTAIGIADLLAAAGYDIAGRYFRRPGKTDRGFSGILRLDKHGRLVSAHWSTNDPLNDHRFGGGTVGIHDAFSAFTVLEHGGNVSAAVKAAASLFGMSVPKQRDDLAVLREIAHGADADTFAASFFANRQNAATRADMRAVLVRHTSNPHQINRILAMARPGEEQEAA